MKIGLKILSKYRQSFTALSLTAILIAGCALHPNGVSRITDSEQLAQPIDPLTKLRYDLDYMFSTPDFVNAHWGVAIQSLNTGEYIYLRNENKGFMPASNMKLFTTAAALIKLGPDYRFRTVLYRTGEISDAGILTGNLVIRGCGDPSLCGRYNDGRITKVFEDWADSLKAAGITTITGDIIGDDNYFDDEIMGAGWAWDYQSDWYAAQISALSFNDNCVDIIFTAGDSVGSLATYRLEPATDYVQVESRVTTVEEGKDAEIFYDRKRGTNEVEITGTITIGEKDKCDWFSVENPTLYAAYVLREVLISKGIEVQGKSRDIDDITDFSYQQTDGLQLTIHESPPLKDIIHTINKVSQNLYAELLMRTLGARFGAAGNGPEGAKVTADVYARMGINPNFLGLADGSGLSRYDLITPMSMVTLLRYMRNSRHGDIFYNTLPIAGVDGTIAKRMKGTAAQHNVRAKTGSLDRVRALSGYVTSKDDEEFVFAMIVNNYTVPRPMADDIQNTVCVQLANFSR